MSWLKFWGKKSSKKDDKRSRSELVRSGSFKDDPNWQGDGDRDKNGKLRHSMSISRSGRFKQKNKQRSGILDKPEFYNDSETSDSQKENRDNTSYGVSSVNNNARESKRTPPSTCREVSKNQPITSHHYIEGHSTVL